MDANSAAHLFIYGTLRADAPGRLGRAQRARLARESEVVGGATMPGRLVDLGRYPGLVEPLSRGDMVHGVVVLLAEPERSLRWLDAYEAVVPGAHDHNEYVREIRTATLSAGGNVQTWVYLYRQEIRGPLIAGGDWVAHARG